MNFDSTDKKPCVVDDCSVLVASCDAYSDLWTPFFTLFRRHWIDCPFPVYLGAGRMEGAQAGVRTLFSGGGRDWSRCMREYLEQLAQPYVLVMLDDFFLRRKVPTTKVADCLAFARDHNATQVRLIPRPGPTDRIPGETLLGECAPGLPYRLSTQAAIWNRIKLIELLRPGESIWEFEHNGNHRAAEEAHGFYAVWRAVLPYEGVFAHHVIEKGKWLRHEKWIFGREKIGCDFARRETMSWEYTLFYYAIATIDRILRVLPWRWSLRVKKQLRRLFGTILRRQMSRLSGIV